MHNVCACVRAQVYLLQACMYRMHSFQIDHFFENSF